MTKTPASNPANDGNVGGWGSSIGDGWLDIRPVVVAPGQTRRTAEGLAWRAIVRQRLGNDIAISYAPSGAPVVSRGYIGVSHTRGWVAVIWSPRPCAIDIELKTRRLSPATSARIAAMTDTITATMTGATTPSMTADDSSHPIDLADPENPAKLTNPLAAWCAYEARYKYQSLTGPATSDHSADPAVGLTTDPTSDPAELENPTADPASAPPTLKFLPHPDLIIAAIY